MPLPHFLILILAVILAAGLTIWAASAIGIPLFALGFLALLAAAIAHLTTRDHRSLSPLRSRRTGWRKGAAGAVFRFFCGVTPRHCPASRRFP